MSSPNSLKRRKWSKENLKAAIQACLSGEMGYLKAQLTFGVPRATLHRFLKLVQNNVDTNIDTILEVNLGRKPVFPAGLEKELAAHCLEMERKFFGLTKSDVVQLAFQVAEIRGVSTPFNKDNKVAGRKWFKNFINRNSNLSLRTPQATSIGRVKGFNKGSVSEFFKLLEMAYEKHTYPANRVFNCDETGVTIVQGKQVKIVAKKGKKQVGSLTSAERGSLVTIVACVSAGGTYVPPLIIFPRERMKNELTDGAPPGAIFACHKSGWIQLEMFTTWFKHFINYTKPSAEDPVILVLDGHYSHTRNLDVILHARESHVTIVCLPPHCSHRLQPLDVAFMRPFKGYYNEEVRTWLANHRDPVRPLTHYQISSLIGKAFAKAATMENAISGFRKTGIYPINPNVFMDQDFVEEQFGEEPENINEANNSNTTASSAVLQDICPFPVFKTTENVPMVGRRKGKAKILTSTPNKEELEASISAKVKTTKVAQVKKQVFNKKRKRSSSSSSSEDDLVLSSDSEDSDAECLYCHKLWSESTGLGEWVKCQGCHRWAHVKCAGNPKKQFRCLACTGLNDLKKSKRSQ